MDMLRSPRGEIVAAVWYSYVVAITGNKLLAWPPCGDVLMILKRTWQKLNFVALIVFSRIGTG